MGGSRGSMVACEAGKSKNEDLKEEKVLKKGCIAV